MYASDGDVTFTSSIPLAYMSRTGGTSSRWLLDDDAVFHVTSCREWFSSFSSGRLGRVHLADGSAYDIAGAGDVYLSLPSGASYTLRHVRYVPEIGQSLISMRQLADYGCHVSLREQSFQMRCGSLVIARGDRSGLISPLYVSEVHDGLVSIMLLTCGARETRRVSFAVDLEHAQETEHLAMQDMSVDSAAVAEVERDCFSETQQDILPMMEMSDMEFFDMLMSDESHDAQTLVEQVEPVVQVQSIDSQIEVCSSHPQLETVRTSSHRQVEQECSSESQLGMSSSMMAEMADLDAEDTVVMQSFLDMLMPELDADASEIDDASDMSHMTDSGQGDTLGMHVICSGHEETLQVLESECHDLQDRGEVASSPEITNGLEWSSESQLSEIVRLAEIARVASAFESLMYDLLVSRPDIAAAVGAFAVGVVSRMVIDTGIEHGGAVQVITRYLQDVRACSSRDAHVCLSLERIHMHAHSSRDSVGVG